MVFASALNFLDGEICTVQEPSIMKTMMMMMTCKAQICPCCNSMLIALINFVTQYLSVSIVVVCDPRAHTSR